MTWMLLYDWRLVIGTDEKGIPQVNRPCGLRKEIFLSCRRDSGPHHGTDPVRRDEKFGEASREKFS